MLETKFNKKKALINVIFYPSSDEKVLVKVFADYFTTIDNVHYFAHKKFYHIDENLQPIYTTGLKVVEYSSGLVVCSESKPNLMPKLLEILGKNDIHAELKRHEVINIDAENYINTFLNVAKKEKKQTEKLTAKSVLSGAKIFYEKNEIDKDAILFDKKFVPFVFELCENAKGLKFEVVLKTETFEDSVWVAGNSFASGKFERIEKIITANMLQITHNTGSYNIALDDINLVYFIPTLKAICAQYSIEYANSLEMEFEPICEPVVLIEPAIKPIATPTTNKPQIRKQKTKKPKTLIALPMPQRKTKEKRKKRRIKPEKSKSNTFALLHKKVAEIGKEMELLRLLLYSFKYPLSTFARWLQNFTPNIPTTPLRQFLELTYSPSRFFTNIFHFNKYGLHTSRFRLNWSSG